MPVNPTSSFTIKGNTKSATTAAKQFGEAVTSLNRRLNALLKKKTQMDGFNRSLTAGSTRMRTWTTNAKNVANAARELTTALRDLHDTQQQMQPAETPQPTNYQNLYGAMAQYAQGQVQPERMVSGLTQAVGLVSTLKSGIGGVATAFLAVAGVIKSAVGGAIKKVKSMWGEFQQKISTASKSLSSFYSSFVRWGMNVTDGLRLMTLGLTNMARSLMFFVSIPLSAFLYQAINVILDFDDQMKKVQKTTGVASETLEDLRGELRALAITTATTHVQLAKMAEDAGQLGLKTVKGIMGMVTLGNMLAIATDIAEDEVVETLGRIANAFNYNLDKSSDEIYRLANVINMLENETETSAQEIVEALYQFAPVAADLEMASWQAAAFGATLASMGYDASKAGTSLRNIGVYMTKNSETVQHLLSATEKYSAAGSVAAAMQEDFTQVMIDFIMAASQEEDLIKRVTGLYDLLNMRGARGAESLAKNIDDLLRNLQIAHQEFLNGESLLREYDRAMSSTKNQLAVLRNNFTELGITIGDVFLPQVNKLIQMLIPAVQMLTAWYSKLDPVMQKWIVLMIAAVAVGGPLAMFIFQVIHGIFLMAMGFVTLLKTIPFVIGSIFTLAKAILSVIGIFSGWRLVVIGGIFLILKALQAMGVDVAGFFTNLADRAIAWGERLAAQWSSGFLQGAVRWIAAAIAWVANLIGSFFAAHSPPEKGPLAQIEKWGQSLMETYLRAFTLADFTILQQVGRMIESAFESIGLQGKKADDWAIKMTQAARQALAKLLAVFNETGEISEDLINKVVKGLGGLSGPVAELIRRWLKYQQIQKELAELEKKRKAADKAYRERLKAISEMNVSAEERVRLIREAMKAHLMETEELDEQEEKMEEQADLAKDELDWQRAFVDALQDENTLSDKLLRTLERMADALGGISEMTFPEIPEGAFPEPEDIFDPDDFEALYDLPRRIEEAKIALQGFLAGLSGKQIDWATWLGLDYEGRGVFKEFWEIGNKLSAFPTGVKAAFDALRGERMPHDEYLNLTPENQKLYDKIFGFVTGLKTTFDELSTAAGAALVKIWEFFEKLFGGKKDKSDILKKNPLDKLKLQLKNLALAFLELIGVLDYLKGFLSVDPFKPLASLREDFEPLAESIDKLKTAIEEMLDAILENEFLRSWAEYLLFLGYCVWWLGSQFMWVAGTAVGYFLKSLLWGLGVLAELLVFVVDYMTIWAQFIDDVASGKGLGEATATFITKLRELGGSIKDYFKNELPESIKEDLEHTGTTSGELFGNSMIEGMEKSLTTKYKDQVLAKLRETTGEVETYMETEQKPKIVDGWGTVGEEGGLKYLKKTGGVVKEQFGTEVVDPALESLKTLGWKSGEYLDLTFPDEIKGPASDAGETIATELADGISETIEDKLPDSIGAPIDEELLNAVNLMANRSGEFYASGEELVGGLSEGVLQGMPPMQADMIMRIVELEGQIEQHKYAFDTRGYYLSDAFRDGILDPAVWNTIKSTLSINLNNLISKIKEKQGAFYTAAKTMLNNIYYGLTDSNTWASIKSSMLAKLNDIISALDKKWKTFLAGLDIDIKVPKGGGDDGGDDDEPYLPAPPPPPTPKDPYLPPAPPPDGQGPFQFGGRILAGLPALVGEVGPELFLPAVDGWILNRYQASQALADMLGIARSAGSVNVGVVNQVEVNINYPTVRDDYDLAELRRFIEKVVNDKVINANRFRGQLAAT